MTAATTKIALDKQRSSWTTSSKMQDVAGDINQRIAAQLRRLRAAAGLSLAALAGRSGVSRSMLSLIERGESSPTAALLERLAVGLNVPLATMFEGVVEGDAPKEPVRRRAARSEWRDPDTGYVRSNLSPPQVPQPLQLAEVELPVKARVVFESPARDVKIYQQILVLEGAIEVTCENQRHRLAVGDCLAMQVEGTSVFENPSRQTARYLVASATEVISRRRA